MNQRTFRAWLITLGYEWTAEEGIVKGFMSKHEAEALIGEYEAEGKLARRGESN